MTDSEIFLYMKQINDRMQSLYNENLKTWDLTFSQAHVLERIFRNGGQSSQKKLETELGVSHPTIAGLVSRLEKNGFITTHVDEKDRRNKIAVSTKKAELHRDAVTNQRKNYERSQMKGLSDSDKAILGKLLKKVRDNTLDLSAEEHPEKNLM